MLKISGLTKHFGGQSIFRRADWFVGAHDRVALVGRNGSGKSTLLKIIAGEESYDEGAIDRPKGLHIGYLAQSGFVVGTGSVREEARQAFREVLSLESELGEVERRLPHAPHGELERLSVRAAELHERLAILGANEIDRRIHQVLTGLGFRERDFDRPMGDLSGGWQMRAALARILLERPEMLMLDEPTNHLDLEAREWLEGYLQDYPYAFVLVSHDRYFLNVTVERVCEIAGYGMDNYAGGYGYYEAEREKRYALRLKAYEEQQDEIKRLHRFIDRNRANKRMAGRTHSRMLVLEKMERLDPPDPPPRPLRMRYPHCPHSGRVVLELDRAAKRYGELRVLEDVSLRIERGARVALVGPNGAGKSTLMRLLAGHEPPDAGTRAAGYRVEMAYFAQDEGQRFNPRATVYETILGLSPNDFVPELRGLLGAFLFSGDSVEKRVGALSGGELNRLAIACLLVRPSNLLLLDEPTNHLDIVSKDALLESLRHYPGTIVFVSHDRHFLEALADHVIEVGGGELREYHGNYASYLWRRAREESGELRAPQVPAAAGGAAPAVTGLAPGLAPGGAAAGSPATETKAPGEATRAGGARGGRGRTAPGGRLGELEREIADLEARKQRFAQALANPKLFADPAKSAFYMRELKELEEPLQRLYEEWARLSERG